MENEAKSEIVKKVINYFKGENNINNNLIIEKENKKSKFGNLLSLKYSVKKNNELIQLLNDYLEGCQIVDRIINSGVDEHIDNNTIDRYIDVLTNGMKTGNKILNFKYSYFFKRYNLDAYTEEAYINFSEFISSTNEIISKDIIKLKNMKKNNETKTTADNGSKDEKINYSSIKLEKKELEELKKQLLINNEQFDHNIVSLLSSVFDILQKIDSDIVDDELEIMFLLKNNVSEALYLMSISDNDELLSKRNWLIGVYNSAYHNLSKKYAKMNPDDKNKKAIKFENKHQFDFNIDHYSVDSMIKNTNNSLEKYMLDNKEIFQRKSNQVETKSMAEIVFNCISLMDNRSIVALYKKMVTEFHYNPNNYYPEKLQHNFVVAIFNLKKNRNEIQIDQELTPQIQNQIINEFELVDKFMVSDNDLDVSDKKVL